MKWAIKIAAKLFLSRLPINYSAWRTIGIFRNGSMNQMEYARKIFSLHAERCYPNGIPQGLVFLELGPGDSISSAIIANSYSAVKSYLVDVGSYATDDMSSYKNLTESLKRSGLPAPDVDDGTSLGCLLSQCNGAYLKGGIDSLRSIPDDSVDMIWSHSVLEHIREQELTDVLAELMRILKPDGFFSHNIDYQDHLGGALNNLRFPCWMWESNFFAKSGFYTNRVPAEVMHNLFKSVGGVVIKEEFGRWPKMPTDRKWLAKEFDAYDDSMLLNRTSHILGTKKFAT